MIILYNLVLRVFISKNPKQAGENFRDKMGRYSPERLAIRVLELRVFKDIPLSDNNWRDYYLSRNKNYVKKTFAPHVDIPDHYFFSPERLLKINMIYDRGLLDSTLPLEEWLVQHIIRQFFAFNSTIRQQVEIEKKDLRATLIEYYAQGIIDTRLRDSIEDFVNDFSAVWES
jgi:hypothetical protein